MRRARKRREATQREEGGDTERERREGKGIMRRARKRREATQRGGALVFSLVGQTLSGPARLDSFIGDEILKFYHYNTSFL